MSFWNQNAVSSTPLVGLLFKEDVTLKEILDEPEVIQECKSQNVMLIDFLTRSDILRELVQLTTKEPEADIDEVTRYKYANVACEVLTSEAPLLVQSLANDSGLLDELYAFLEDSPPLNPLLASFCSRIFTVLISRPSEQNWFSYQVTCLQVLEFIKSKGNCIDLFLRHIGTSAIMDLVHKLYTKIEGLEMKDNLVEWLDEGELIEKLVSLMRPDAPNESKANACELICSFINDYREMTHDSNEKPEPDRIIRKIESQEVIAKLLDVMLQEPSCEGSIVGGISVLLTLLPSSRKENSDETYETWASIPGAAVANIHAAITPHLPALLKVLKNPPYKPPVRTTVGTLQTPFGATRVEVVRLISALVAAGDKDFLDQLKRLNFFNVLLDLFFEYPWNNFLHTEVESTIQAAFQSEDLAHHILTECRLLKRILDAWEDNIAQEKDSKPRKGYMGHLIKIAQYVVEYGRDASLDSAVPSEDADILVSWREFVNTSLTKVLGDQKSTNVGWEEQDSSDDANFYEEALAPSFNEDYFRGDQFGNNEDNGVNTIDLKPEFDDAISDDNLKAQEALFTQICAQRLQIIDDENDDDWKIDDRSSRPWNDDGSSDEEGDEHEGEHGDEWSDLSRTVAPLEQNNPWSADILSASSPDQGWANFESSPFLANFGFDLSSTIATSVPGDSGPVPFDLTPTEAQLFSPNETDSSPPTFLTNDTTNESEPITEETANKSAIEANETSSESIHETVETPNETVPKTDETLNESAPETSNESVPKTNETLNESVPETAETSNESVPETADPSIPPTDYILTPIGEVPAPAPLPAETAMETAEIVETVNSAQVVAFADVAEQLREASMAAVIVTAPTEPVIAQTESSGPPATPPMGPPPVDEAADAEAELAQLLAEVTEATAQKLVVADVLVDSESAIRTPSEDVINGPQRAENDSKWIKSDEVQITNSEPLIANLLVTNCLQTQPVDSQP